jgi:hypothetical protein
MIKKENIISFLVKLLLAFISSLAILLFAEISTRIYGKMKDIDFRLYMQELKNCDRLPKGILEPNSQVLATTSDFSVIYKTNSKGLRDKEYSYMKPKDKIRILAFGDSFTFGEGVGDGERFTDIPENYFSNLEIINFGVPGYGLDQELVYFVAEGLKYSPDYVIIFISVVDVNRYSTNIIRNGTVVLENVVTEKPISDSSTLFLRKDDTFFNTGSSFIIKNSYLFSFLNYQITLFRLKGKLEQFDRKMWEDIRKSPEIRKKLLENRNYAYYIRNRTEMLIRKFNEICKENDIKLIIIKIDDTRGLDYIAKLDSNISYYDLTDGLIAEGKKYSLYFKYDGHYNKKTHHYIGEKIIEILRNIL